MDAEKQQKILGYFIEEAKEHLETLEKGILDLRSVMADSERINEMFRAAHSVKGGAAMLGFGSIQKVAHRLEDCFKILKDHPIPVDSKLESLFLKGYDTLNGLLNQLQGPFGLRQEEGEKIVQAAEPLFTQLQNHLNSLLGPDAVTDEDAIATPQAAPIPQQVASVKISPDFSAKVTGILKQMLQLFKQPETPLSRQQLQTLCNRLVQLGDGINPWQALVQTAHKAISNPKNAFSTLAPILIKELKQGSDLLQAGKANAIAASPSLQQLANLPAAPATTQPKQITIPVEPRAAAKALYQAFNKQQLTELVMILHKAIKT